MRLLIIALILLLVAERHHALCVARPLIRRTCLSSSSSSMSTPLQALTSSPTAVEAQAEEEDEDEKLYGHLYEKKVPIGSAPQFAIAGDSTEETPYQRGVVFVHFALTLANLLHARYSIASLVDIVPLALTIMASIVLGDLGTGIFHWSVDNYGGIKTPVFGSVCVAFQGHHDTPWTITFRSFCNNVFKIAYGTIPPLLLLLLAGPTIVSPLARIFATLFINWWLISQEFHKYSHMRSTPPLAKKLQEMGIILSKKEHGLHHTSPFEGHYCILTGVCNPLLDKTHFFRHLERFFFAVTGNTPNTWKADPKLRDVGRFF